MLGSLHAHTSRIEMRAALSGSLQKMRRENRRSTASSRSCGRLVAPSTTTLVCVLDLH